MNDSTITPATLESLLETGFGAKGLSVTEKLLSVESRLPAPLVTQLRAVFATARQLETGGTVDISSYRRMLESSAEQLRLLSVPQVPPASEAKQVIAPSVPVRVRRLDDPGGARPRTASRLRAWLFETRQRIPARAQRLARTWRLPGTMLGGLGGAVAGWFLAGIGGAIAGGLMLGLIAFFGLSEARLAQALWAQTRLVEKALALLRWLGRAALAVLAVVIVGLIVFFVTRFWNVGKP